MIVTSALNLFPLPFTLLLKLFHDTSSSRIADVQFPLQERGGNLLVLLYQLLSRIQERVLGKTSLPGSSPGWHQLPNLQLCCFFPALITPEIDQSLGLGIRYPAPLETFRFRRISRLSAPTMSRIVREST